MSHLLRMLLLNQSKTGDIMLNLPNTSRSFNTSSATLNPLQIPSCRVIKKTKKPFIRPLLTRISNESEWEYQELQQVFKLLGWHKVPDILKVEIYDDVRVMLEELRGNYSSCDPYVHNRRNRVHYWVQSFLDGTSSLKTAIEALKIQSLK
ncbi:MAG: hypothetical protein VX062_02050 [Bacteroidota bacterium]|nr:hypothetical protein [Bacteroidota bacterium]